MTDKRTRAGFWGESKKRFNIMLTPTALERLEEVSKGEILERLCRSELCTPEKFSQLLASKWIEKAMTISPDVVSKNKENTISD